MVDYSAIFEKQTLAEFQSAAQKVFIEQRLKRFNGNMAKTAISLGIQRSHLYNLRNNLKLTVDRNKIVPGNLVPGEWYKAYEK